MADILNNQNPTASTPSPAPNTPPQQPLNTPTDTGNEFVKDSLAPEDLDTQWTRWKCGVCNYTYEGSTVLSKCPKCGNEDSEKFIDAD